MGKKSAVSIAVLGFLFWSVRPSFAAQGNSVLDCLKNSAEAKTWTCSKSSSSEPPSAGESRRIPPEIHHLDARRKAGVSILLHPIGKDPHGSGGGGGGKHVSAHAASTHTD